MNSGCCAVAIAFILAQAFVSLNPNIKKESREFLATLDKSQKIYYQLVVNERMDIYKRSTIIGIAVGILAMMMCPNKLPPIAKGCIFLSVAFLTQYFSYILSPKKFSMVTTLKGEQIQEWQDVYTEYQWNYHMGLAVGLIGYFLLGYGW